MTSPKRRALLSFTFLIPVLGSAALEACSSSSSSSGDDSSVATDSGSQIDSTTTFGNDSGPQKIIDSGVDVDAAPAKKYCASDSLIVDAGPDADAIAPATPQQFDTTMAGCPGVVEFQDRATLCAASCTPCSAQDWILHHGNAAPAYDYWTNDNLGYEGEYDQGFACTANPFPADAAAPGPDTCTEFTLADGGVGLSPMRVCVDHLENPFGETLSDSLGNACNWSKCAYETDLSVPTVVDAGPDAAPPVFDHMGGCDGNLTAGTLCCCE
jgi:hypothetical protein